MYSKGKYQKHDFRKKASLNLTRQIPTPPPNPLNQKLKSQDDEEWLSSPDWDQKNLIVILLGSHFPRIRALGHVSCKCCYLGWQFSPRIRIPDTRFVWRPIIQFERNAEGMHLGALVAEEIHSIFCHVHLLLFYSHNPLFLSLASR